ELPTDRPRPAVASHRGDRVAFRLSAQLHRGLLGLAGENGARLFMVLHAGLVGLTKRLGAGEGCAIGSADRGRGGEARGGRRWVFWNAWLLGPARWGIPSFRGLISGVRASNLTAYGHQDLPFERLVEALNPVRSLARHPLFQLMLSHHGEGQLGLELFGL